MNIYAALWLFDATTTQIIIDRLTGWLDFRYSSSISKQELDGGNLGSVGALWLEISSKAVLLDGILVAVEPVARQIETAQRQNALGVIPSESQLIASSVAQLDGAIDSGLDVKPVIGSQLEVVYGGLGANKARTPRPDGRNLVEGHIPFLATRIESTRLSNLCPLTKQLRYLSC